MFVLGNGGDGFVRVGAGVRSSTAMDSWCVLPVCPKITKPGNHAIIQGLGGNYVSSQICGGKCCCGNFHGDPWISCGIFCGHSQEFCGVHGFADLVKLSHRCYSQCRGDPFATLCGDEG